MSVIVPADTRTEWQKTLFEGAYPNVVDGLSRLPGVRTPGLSPDRNGDGRISPEEWVKECPCFEVTSKLYE